MMQEYRLEKASMIFETRVGDLELNANQGVVKLKGKDITLDAERIIIDGEIVIKGQRSAGGSQTPAQRAAGGSGNRVSNLSGQSAPFTTVGSDPGQIGADHSGPGGPPKFSLNDINTAIEGNSSANAAAFVGPRTGIRRGGGEVQGGEQIGPRGGPGAPNGDAMAPAGTSPISSGTTVVTSPSGHKFRIASNYAKNFEGFIKDYEAAGGVISNASGGLSSRPGNASYHPLGKAIDVNQIGYGVRSKTGATLPTEIEDHLAEKWGLFSGNKFRRPDTGHFEVRNGAKATGALGKLGFTQDPNTGEWIQPKDFQYGQIPEDLAKKYPQYSTSTNKSTGSLTSEKNGQVDAQNLYRSSIERISNSPLNGFVPSDGAKFGITKGTPEEWARLLIANAKQESGLNANSNGGGLYQFEQGDLARYGQKGANVNDPLAQLNAAVTQMEKSIPKDGFISGRTDRTKSGWGGMSDYFGSIRRSNETTKHLDWANKIASSFKSQPGDLSKSISMPGIPNFGERLSPEEMKKFEAKDTSAVKPQGLVDDDSRQGLNNILNFNKTKDWESNFKMSDKYRGLPDSTSPFYDLREMSPQQEAEAMSKIPSMPHDLPLRGKYDKDIEAAAFKDTSTDFNSRFSDWHQFKGPIWTNYDGKHPLSESPWTSTYEGNSDIGAKENDAYQFAGRGPGTATPGAPNVENPLAWKKLPGKSQQELNNAFEPDASPLPETVTTPNIESAPDGWEKSPSKSDDEKSKAFSSGAPEHPYSSNIGKRVDNPAHHPERNGPSPESNGYGDQKSNADGAMGICAF